MPLLRRQDARKLRNTHYFERLLRHSRRGEAEAPRSTAAAGCETAAFTPTDWRKRVGRVKSADRLQRVTACFGESPGLSYVIPGRYYVTLSIGKTGMTRPPSRARHPATPRRQPNIRQAPARVQREHQTAYLSPAADRGRPGGTKAGSQIRPPM